MDVETLIDTLARDVKPVPRGTAGRRIALGVGAGAIVTFALILVVIGVNPALADVAAHYSFWLKWTYSLSLGLLALSLVRRLGSPEDGLPRWTWALILPVAAVAAVGIAEMAMVPPSQWLAMWLGETWMLCPWLVLSLGMPIFIGLLWSFRRMAPTRLRAAGAAAGLAAGAIGAMIYCLHCPEMSAIFVLTWYTLGIGLAAALGALIGPRVLRW